MNVVRFAFQTMVGIGTALALLGVVFAWRPGSASGGCRESRWFYRAVVAAGPLSLVALIAGWVTTEVGRQPWVVFRVMRTAEAVTGASGIPVGYATLVAVYAASRRRRRVGAATARAGAAGVIRAGPLARRRNGGAWIWLMSRVALMLAGLTAYAVLGGADFGAGFW